MRWIAIAAVLCACSTSSGPGSGNAVIRLYNSTRAANLRVTVDGVRGQPITLTLPTANVPPYDGPIADVHLTLQPGDAVSISATAPGPLANDTTCMAGPGIVEDPADPTTGFADVLVIVQGGAIAFQCDIPNWQ
jgi:hypothetical protein